jgi:hypothetical protein
MSGTYCTLLRWVEDKNKKLAEAIVNLCADGYLRPRGGPDSSGITFFYPEDSALLKKIIDAPSKPDSEQQEALAIIKRHIVPTALLSAEDAANMKEIPNLLYRKIPVKSASKGNIEFENSSKATLYTKFIGRSDKAPMAVWTVSGKNGVPDSAEQVEMKSFFASRRGPPKQLGSSSSSNTAQNVEKKVKGGGRYPISNRQQFARFILDAYVKEFTTKLNKAEGKTTDPFLESVVSALVWTYAKHREAFNSIMLVMSPLPQISFYLLFEPFKSGGSYLFPWFEEWQNDTMGYAASNNPRETFKKCFDKLACDEKSPFVACSKSGRQQIFEEIGKIRDQLFDEKTSSKDLLPRALRDLYYNLSVNNTIGKLQNVLPEHLSAYYQANPEAKCTQDEIRFLITQQFQDIQSGISDDIRQITGALYKLESNLKRRFNFSNSVDQCSFIFSELTMKQCISAAMWYSCPLAFTRTDCLLFVASPFDESRKPSNAEDYIGSVSQLQNLHEDQPSRLCFVDMFSCDRELSDQSSLQQETNKLAAFKQAIECAEAFA